MKHFKMIVCIIVLVTFISSCATGYRPIRFNQLPYEKNVENKDYSIDIVRHLMSASNNTRYENKAAKINLQIYAVQVTNHTSEPITITTNNFVATHGGNQLTLSRMEDVVRILKQPEALYLLWGLLWMYVCKGDENGGSCTPLPIGLVIGVINMATASSANKNLAGDLTQNELIGQVVEPGGSVIGTVAYFGEEYPDLAFQIK